MHRLSLFAAALVGCANPVPFDGTDTDTDAHTDGTVDTDPVGDTDPRAQIDDDNDGYAANVDCDDKNPLVNPG